MNVMPVKGNLLTPAHKVMFTGNVPDISHPILFSYLPYTLENVNNVHNGTLWPDVSTAKGNKL